MSTNLKSLFNATKDFNPKEDKLNTSLRLPEGDYPVRLDKVEHDANVNSGRENIIVTLTVTSGEFETLYEKIYLSFDSDLPEFVQERNIKLYRKLLAYCDIEIKSMKEVETLDAMVETLQAGIGKTFGLQLQVRENKKNPKYPYRNRDLCSLSELGFNQPTTEVEEDDLPF